MLKKVVITNHLGESMEYRIDGVEVDNPSGLIITSIDGLGPVKANINMSDLATTDGQLYNSARLSGRNIVIKALFTHATSIEEARLLSYKYFPIKKKIKFHIETDNRIGETEGYVESNEPDIFSEESSCQISILCENPYFDGGKVTYPFRDTEPLFKFEFANESLDEPLLKMSKNLETTDAREIIYTGDADTGMEIEIGVPTDDVLDTLSATNIEIVGEDGKKIKIDTSKMISQVPNTSPTNTIYSKCFFIMDNNRYKCREVFLDNIEATYPIIYKGELQCFYTDNGVIRRLKLDVNTKKWINIGEFGSLGGDDPTWLLCLNDKIYAYVWNHYKIYKLNEETKEWDIVVRYVDGPVSEAYGHIGVVYKNAIHCFDVGMNGSTRINIHSIFNGQSYYRASDTSNMQNVLGSSYLFGSNSMYAQAAAFEYDGLLHIIGGSTGVSGGTNNKHFITDGTINGWQELTDNKYILPDSYGFNGWIQSLTEYQNKIHIFGNSANKHYTYDSQNGWIKSFDTPFRFGSKERNHLIADSDYMYLLGADNGNILDNYTEPENNVKLIENDKLVINTNKGQKSVYLYRNGNKYNVINSLDKGSSWLQLYRGVNRFSYNADSGIDDIKISMITNKWYEGV